MAEITTTKHARLRLQPTAGTPSPSLLCVGIDEVGRGCWAGPLVAGAVRLSAPIPGLRDSKQLTKAARERLAAQIHHQATFIGLGWVWPAEIDSGGITAAVKAAMSRALATLNTDSSYDEIIIDGAYNFLADVAKTRTLIRADSLVPAVSAASIVAKVARDRYMTALAEQLPLYGFERHVGYGTAQHRAALEHYGVTEHHRRSFKPIRLLLGE